MEGYLFNYIEVCNHDGFRGQPVFPCLGEGEEQIGTYRVSACDVCKKILRKLSNFIGL
jgi:hypothetical protein